MSGKFKCCEKLFSSYYVCTQCHEIIHKNCVTNKKYKGTLNIIKGNKVNCCTNEVINLEESLCVAEEKNTALEETLQELSIETELKTKHIDKLHTQYKQLLNEASLRDDELNKIIDQNEKTISELRETVESLKLNLNYYVDKAYSSNSTQTEIKTRNASTSTEEFIPRTIPTEHSQAELISRAVPKPKSTTVISRTDNDCVLVREDVMDYQTGTRSPMCGASEDVVNTLQLNTNHILVLSDNYGYNLNYLLKDRLKSVSYQVQSFYKPGAKFENVIENIENLSGNFTQKDHVVIVAGSNNFSSSSDYPRFRDLWNKLKLCLNTNFTFVGVPYSHQSQNRLIYRFNKNLNRFVHKLNTCLPGLFSFIDANGKFNVLSKKKLSNLIYDKIILGNNPQPKNLILINANQKLPNESIPTEDNSLQTESNCGMSTAIENSMVTNSITNDPVEKDTTITVIEPINASPLDNSLSNVQSNFLYPRLSLMSQI